MKKKEIPVKRKKWTSIFTLEISYWLLSSRDVAEDNIIDVQILKEDDGEGDITNQLPKVCWIMDNEYRYHHVNFWILMKQKEQ